MKRSDNEADVQGVLEQFKAVDDMLDRVRAIHTLYVLFNELKRRTVDQRH
jgi:hypothetical protein